MRCISSRIQFLGQIYFIDNSKSLNEARRKSLTVVYEEISNLCFDFSALFSSLSNKILCFFTSYNMRNIDEMEVFHLYYRPKKNIFFPLSCTMYLLFVSIGNMGSPVSVIGTNTIEKNCLRINMKMKVLEWHKCHNTAQIICQWRESKSFNWIRGRAVKVSSLGFKGPEFEAW